MVINLTPENNAQLKMLNVTNAKRKDTSVANALLLLLKKLQLQLM